MTDPEPARGQLTAADVQNLTASRKYDEIEQARQEGRLASLFGTPAEDVDLLDRARHGTDPLTRDDLARLNSIGHSDLVLDAYRAGRTGAHLTEGN